MSLAASSSDVELRPAELLTAADAGRIAAQLAAVNILSRAAVSHAVAPLEFLRHAVAH